MDDKECKITHLCTTLITAMFYSTIVGDLLQQATMKFIENCYRRNIFSEYNILKAMDLAGRTLSYTGIELLGRIETDDVKCASTILPSRASIQNYGNKVELVGENCCPFFQHQVQKA